MTRTQEERDCIVQTDIRASLDAIATLYPQYVGYANGWSEAIARRDTSTKGGLVMLKGDAILVNWESEELGGRRGLPRPFVTIWSARLSCAVSVDKRHIA